MSVSLVGKVLAAPFEPARKIVLVIIADATSDETGEAWPSVPFIAARALLSERTVQRTLREFQASGVLSISRRKRPNGSDTSSVYRINPGPLMRGGDILTPPGPPVGKPVEESAGGDTALSPGGCHSLVTRGVSELCHPLNQKPNPLLTEPSAVQGELPVDNYPLVGSLTTERRSVGGPSS